MGKATLTGALATYRLTHLIIDDEITRGLRDSFQGKVLQYRGRDSKLLYLLTCHWCMSMYTATAISLVEDKRVDIPKILAYSGASSLIDHMQSRVF